MRPPTSAGVSGFLNVGRTHLDQKAHLVVLLADILPELGEGLHEAWSVPTEAVPSQGLAKPGVAGGADKTLPVSSRGRLTY